MQQSKLFLFPHTHKWDRVWEKGKNAILLVSPLLKWTPKHTATIIENLPPLPTSISVYGLARFCLSLKLTLEVVSQGSHFLKDINHFTLLLSRSIINGITAPGAHLPWFPPYCFHCMFSSGDSDLLEAGTASELSILVYGTWLTNQWVKEWNNKIFIRTQTWFPC